MPRNVTKIVAAYTSRETMEHFTRVVPSSEIAKQNYNLAVSTSVKQEEEGEIINII
jgi:type I restriction enzyme M protein